MWTFPNSYAIIAVNAHYIDDQGRRQIKLLALRELVGEHSGENMAALLLRVIKDYKIGKRVGFFVTDNAASKHLISDSRNRLNMDIIEANECLKNWFGSPHSVDDIKLEKAVVTETVNPAAQTQRDLDDDTARNEAGIALVMQDIRVQFNEDKVFIQNGCTEESSGEEDGCDGVNFVNGEAIIDDYWDL